MTGKRSIAAVVSSLQLLYSSYSMVVAVNGGVIDRARPLPTLDVLVNRAMDVSGPSAAKTRPVK